MEQPSSQTDSKYFEPTSNNQNSTSNLGNNFDEKFDEKRKFQNKKSKLKAFSIFLICILLIVGIGIFSLFVGSKNRSLAAMAFDGTGNHKSAFGAEIFRRNPKLASNLFRVDLKKDKCQTAWTESLVNPESAFAGSLRAYTEIAPNNPQYKDQFNIFSDVGLGLNLREQKAQADIWAKANLDLKVVEKEINNPNLSNSTGQLSLEGEVNALATDSAAYFKAKTLDIKTSEGDFRGGVDNWYSQSYNFDQNQKQGVKELSEVAEELLQTKTTDFIAKEDGESLANTICKTIDDIKVEDLQNIEIGREGQKKTYTARPITIKTTDNAKQILEDEIPNQAEKIVKNPKLSNYLKSKYFLTLKLVSGINKIQKNSSSSTPTEQEYQKAIDDLIKQFDKEDLKRTLKNQEQSISQDIKIDVEPTIYYVNSENLSIAAVKNTAKITFSENFYRNYRTQEVKNIFASGITINSYTYQIKQNSEVKLTETPANTRESKYFLEDLEKTDAAKKAKEISENQQSSNSQSSKTQNSSNSSINSNNFTSKSSISSSNNSQTSKKPEIILN
jgi:hypothetical protein